MIKTEFRFVNNPVALMLLTQAFNLVGWSVNIMPNKDGSVDVIVTEIGE